MQVGDKIPLSLVLWDGNAFKHVKAIVRNGKDEIEGSPKKVPYNSFGNYFYKNTDLVVPDGSKVITIEYIVYDDFNMTLESSLHERAHDIFEVMQAPSQSEINDKLDTIINVVTSHGLNDRLVGLIFDDSLTGSLVEEELEGYIFNDDAIVGYIKEEEVLTKIETDTISGVLE